MSLTKQYISLPRLPVGVFSPAAPRWCKERGCTQDSFVPAWRVLCRHLCLSRGNPPGGQVRGSRAPAQAVVLPSISFFCFCCCVIKGFSPASQGFPWLSCAPAAAGSCPDLQNTSFVFKRQQIFYLLPLCLTFQVLSQGRWQEAEALSFLSFKLEGFLLQWADNSQVKSPNCDLRSEMLFLAWDWASCCCSPCRA